MAIAKKDQQTLSTGTPEATGQAKKISRKQKEQTSPLASPTCGNLSDSTSSLSSVSTTATEKRAPPTQKKNKRRRKHKPNNNSSSSKSNNDISEDERNKYVAIDCEMVGAGPNGQHSTLARVTAVDWCGAVLLDIYVKPAMPVTDYRTFVSGITEEHLENAGSLADCRAKVSSLLQDRILVGHGLKNDLAVLGLRHPWHMTRDTAKYAPFMKVRFDDGILWPRKLKELCQEKLKREIQVAGRAHCSAEDAAAAMDLYKLVRNKWEKAMVYKINKTKQIMEQQQQQQAMVCDIPPQ